MAKTVQDDNESAPPSRAPVLIVSGRVAPEVSHAIRTSGYRPVPAESLREIIQRLQRGRHAAAIIDQDRRVLDTLEIVLHLRDFDPDLPILLLGTGRNSLTQAALPRERSLFPVRRDAACAALRATLHRVLGPPAPLGPAPHAQRA